MTQRDLLEVLDFTLGGATPPRFLEHLVEHRHLWDAEFWRQLEVCAYELRPELAVWEISVDESGNLREQRQPLVPVTHL